jgi:hypothetical protein
MDDRVLRGMAKWPDVPAVYGWLALDRRGNWLLKGEPIGNKDIAAYIGRNYERDGGGRWFFQNGPQRVFVELQYTPFVYRVMNGQSAIALEAHTGQRATAISGAWIDHEGAMLVETEHGIGLVDDRDLDTMFNALADANGAALPEDALDEIVQALEKGEDAPLWLKLGESNVKVRPIHGSDLAGRFGFEPNPAASEPRASAAAAR